MARNAIKSEFRTSKMSASGHFVQNLKKKNSYWSEMARNVIESEFRSSKMTDSSHFVKFFKNIKLHIYIYRSEMARNAIKS